MADAEPTGVNRSALTDDDDLWSPDGLWFDARGMPWIHRRRRLRHVTHCLLLATIAVEVGDGAEATVSKAATSAPEPGPSGGAVLTGRSGTGKLGSLAR